MRLEEVDDAALVRLTAAGLAGIGGTLLVAPGLIARLWLGANDPTTRALLRMLGARDLAIAAGMGSAQRRGRPVRAWLGAATVAATVDGLASAARWDDLPTTGRVLGVGASAVAALVTAGLARRVANTESSGYLRIGDSA